VSGNMNKPGRDESQARPVLPAGLLVAGRPCLVVGGGAIGARKVGHLLDAAADVTVVSPRVTDALRDLAANGRIRLELRAFADGDVEGQYLVFAVTDSRHVNHRIIECCRAHGVLCSAADENWPEGDFITPAITRHGGVVVTVSTGGRSCRLARVIKDRLAELIAAIVAKEESEQSED